MAATQQNRQANFRSSLGADVLMLVDMFGSEKVSGLFEYELTVVSEDENIDLYSILGEHARVELDLPGGGKRYFAGHVCSFTFSSFRDNFAEYRILLRPWMWMLTRASNNRIFQGDTVPDIIKAVCQDHGFTDIDKRLTRSYAARNYCVQYRESDFDFISRLMEEEGIYYFFEHEEGKHTLILADDISAHETFGKYDIVPWYPPDAHDHRERESLADWSMSRGIRSGSVTLRDFDFTKPGADLNVMSRMAKPHAHAKYERYEYPGGYTAVRSGEDLSRLRLEEHQTDHEVLSGHGNARGLIPGFLFTLELFPREDQNREYLILEVTHRLHQGGFDSGGVDEGSGLEYDCSINAMPSNEPYRPPRITPAPLMHGPQTAIVVGESGEDIWTNEYGQVKVQFHWNRNRQRNQNSSCWVRVAQIWAGKQWGAQFLPRIGQEVVVDFLEGDPDRPIIIGSVYNGDNKPPYDLPANATQSGIKSRSSKSGTRDNFNEIRFEDKKGSEQLYIHAEKNMDTRVENCQTSSVDVNRTVTIGKDDKETVKGNRERKVDGKEDVTVIKDWTQTVSKGDWSTTISLGKWTHQSHGISITSLTNNIEVTATIGSLNLFGMSSILMNSSGPITITTPQAMTVSAGAGVTVTAPGGINIVDSRYSNMGVLEKKIAMDFEKFCNGFTKDATLMASSYIGGIETSIKNVVTGFTNMKMETTTTSFIKAGFDMKDSETDMSNSKFSLKKAVLSMFG
ncbi:MAG: type VI secretion system tip protein VgrG [Gammaproteobacteria bacterium HGW-Gammaproteobacteria-8]|nr:MAG: type VI secretion system tip protein VgrG [Gammaproteobacteria bacterium HGW-Gammaproteobacteria-8]